METSFIISLILNILAVLLTIVGTVVMMLGIDADEHLAGDGLKSIKYFTVQSNLLFGAYAAVFAVCQLIYRSQEKMPQPLYTLKYVFTVGVTLTMLTVVLYLAPIVEKSYPPLFKGANLYFHLLVPLLGVISFCFFETGVKLSVIQTLYGFIPFGLYGIFYSTNALTHAKNGEVDEKYDWYRFLKGGTKSAIPAILIMTAATLAVCFGLRALNQLTINS